jgi:hypothetical protein
MVSFLEDGVGKHAHAGSAARSGFRVYGRSSVADEAITKGPEELKSFDGFSTLVRPIQPT